MLGGTSAFGRFPQMELIYKIDKAPGGEEIFSIGAMFAHADVESAACLSGDRKPFRSLLVGGVPVGDALGECRQARFGAALLGEDRLGGVGPRGDLRVSHLVGDGVVRPARDRRLGR